MGPAAVCRARLQFTGAPYDSPLPFCLPVNVVFLPAARVDAALFSSGPCNLFPPPDLCSGWACILQPGFLPWQLPRCQPPLPPLAPYSRKPFPLSFCSPTCPLYNRTTSKDSFSLVFHAVGFFCARGLPALPLAGGAAWQAVIWYTICPVGAELRAKNAEIGRASL